MKKFVQFNTKTYLVPIIFLVLFIAFGVYSFLRIQSQIVDYYVNKLISISQVQEVKINMFFENVRFKLGSLRYSPTLKSELKVLTSANKFSQNPILDELFDNKFSEFGLLEVLIFDTKGKLIYQKGPSIEDRNFVDKSNFNFDQDSILISELFYDNKTNKSVFETRVLLPFDNNKSFVFYAQFDARKSLYKILKSDFEQLNGFESMLAQVRDNVITYISDSRYLGNIAFKLQEALYPIQLNRESRTSGKKFFEGLDYRGQKVYAYVNFLPKYNWFLLVKFDQEEIYRELKKIYFRIFGTIFAVTAIFFGIMMTYIKREKEELIKQTDSLRKQKELIKKQYEYITKIANDAIVIVDNQNRIVDYNDKFVEFYKIEKPENMSLNLLDYFSENLKNQWKDYLKNIKENNGLVFEAVTKKTDGEVFNVQISAKYVEIEENEFLILIIRDFEERKRIEDELRNAKFKAEESDRLKSNFLSMMSHEVRTPVNIILGSVDILKNEIDPDTYQANEHLFDMITRNSKRLLTLISDIIDISRIESNELKLEFIIRNAESLILDVVSEYEQTAKQKGLQIITDFKATNPYIRIDEVRFQQIITNLLNNAIKFTSKGGITITTKNEGENLYISVKDTGIGIPKSALKDIFGLFRQAHEGYSRNFEGAGLGLTITQKLTKMMGGEIYVESEVNVGSTFTVLFPVIKSEELDENLLKLLEERHKSSFKPTILIIDNDKDDQFYLESLMVRLGVEYFTIQEGKKLVSFLKHKPVDCVIYSINIQNEIEAEKVVDEVRNKLKLENLKMIGLLSPESIISESRLKELGFNQVRTKPVSFEELSRMLIQVMAT
ncbi:MAG: PAS domain S-box protein [Ignavibacteria bacterium]|nr:PAS domain S-box protein [Ignavibacteria bacterium]